MSKTQPKYKVVLNVAVECCRPNAKVKHAKHFKEIFKRKQKKEKDCEKLSLKREERKKQTLSMMANNAKEAINQMTMIRIEDD